MSETWNFAAGPAMLPREVIAEAQAELADWQGLGYSVIEASHRGKPFSELLLRAEDRLRALLGIPENYHVLFLQGGATLQFSAVPLNLLPEGSSADYVISGAWAKKAAKEAERYGSIRKIGYATKDALVSPGEWEDVSNASYLHVTTNETIDGLQMHELPIHDSVPIVADMSSDILSRPFPFERFGLVYAGAQKNIGPAGLTLVIVRDDLVGRAWPGTPTLLDYAVQVAGKSVTNTPATFAIYLADLVFAWVESIGGLEAVAARNDAKAELLYATIDESALFANTVEAGSRSKMNVIFSLTNPALESAFLVESAAAGLLELKGHRDVGGFRASLYNAMPLEGVQALTSFMREFERTH